MINFVKLIFNKWASSCECVPPKTKFGNPLINLISPHLKQQLQYIEWKIKFIYSNESITYMKLDLGM